MPTKTYLTDLTYEVLGCAIDVHKHLGPGLLESVYERCLAHELHLEEIKFKQQFTVGIEYKDLLLDAPLRCDFLVENCLVVELKSVKTLLPVHEAQLLTYMKLLQAPKGILINFNVVNVMQDGQKTMVNTFFRDLPEY